MTAQQHLDLANQYHDEAMMHLNAVSSATVAGLDAPMEHWKEYTRLNKLANKHYGIWKGVSTRKLNRALAGI